MIRAVLFDYGAVICRLPSLEEWTEFAGAFSCEIGFVKPERRIYEYLSLRRLRMCVAW